MERRCKMTSTKQMAKIVSDVMTVLFHYYKFTRPEDLMRWTTRKDGSLCSRIRDAFERAKICFNKLVFRGVCKIVVTNVVKRRANYVTHARQAYFGKME